MGRVRSNTFRTIKSSQRRGFKCSECNKCFASKRYLKKHSARGHVSRGGDDGELACSMCAKTFTYLSHLRRHQLSHLNVREHECAHCEEKFLQRTHLLMHVARKHAVSVQHPASATSSEAFDELRKVQCTECDASFETQWHLTRHQNRRHKERFCLTCGEKFVSVNALREHSSHHDATRTHHCTVCQRRFHRSSELKLHEQSHAARGNLLCVRCNAVFIQRTQLDRHIARAHDMRRSCVTCAEHFSAITQYCSHMRIIHSETTCVYCGSTDTSREHREATHWRRLAEPRSLTLPIQQLQPDHEEPTLKLVVLLKDRSVNNGEPIKVHKGFPPGLIDAFPGLADLEIRVTDFAVDESMKSIVLSFPVETKAADDPRVANFIRTPVYIDLK